MKKLNKNWVKRSIHSTKFIILLLGLAFYIGYPSVTLAYTPPAPVNPQSGAEGLTGTIPSPPPTVPATIATPANNQTFTTVPYTVQGICQTGLLIKLFINEVFAGAAICTNGSYSIIAALFNGTNVLVVRDYDALDQQGPDSNTITVNFVNPNIGAGQGVTLTSAFAKLGTSPGSALSWPLVLSGGNPAYALSVVWGDGKPDTLLSQNSPGTFKISHIFQTAGVYTILVRATDASGNIAYLQLVGVANGPAGQAPASTTLLTPPSAAVKGIKLTNTTLFIIIGVVTIIPITAFWLGSRHRLINIKKRFESGQGL